METTYLLGVFLPKDIKDGDEVSFKHYIPVKITELQKAMLIASPEKRRLFAERASESLKDEDPELMGSYADSHNFVIIDPNERLGKELEPYIVALQKSEPPDLVVDLSQEEILRRH